MQNPLVVTLGKRSRGKLVATKQPPAQADGLVRWTESPNTGPRPVGSPPCESYLRDSARNDGCPDEDGSKLPVTGFYHDGNGQVYCRLVHRQQVASARVM